VDRRTKAAMLQAIGEIQHAIEPFDRAYRDLQRAFDRARDEATPEAARRLWMSCGPRLWKQDIRRSMLANRLQDVIEEPPGTGRPIADLSAVFRVRMREL